MEWAKPDSASKTETTSVIVVLGGSDLSQSLLIAFQVWSKGWGSPGRGGRDPSSIE